MTLQRPFSELDWQMIPEMVRQYIVLLEQKLHHMQLMFEDTKVPLAIHGVW